MLLRTAIVLALTLTTNTSSVVHQKQPWEWTTEERIAARTDPEARRQRVVAAQARRDKRGAAETNATALPPTLDDLSGRDHPELFLPSELLMMFVATAYAYDDDFAHGMREDAARAAAKIGLPADFMDVFERETAVTAQLQAEEFQRVDRGAAGDRQAWADVLRLRAEQCPARAAAIERLRVMYGSRFDQFLYEFIARGMGTSYQSAPPPTADELRRMEGGCR